jgi:hypothetical protein
MLLPQPLSKLTPCSFDAPWFKSRPAKSDLFFFARAFARIAYWVLSGFPFTKYMCIPVYGATPKLKARMA